MINTVIVIFLAILLIVPTINSSSNTNSDFASSVRKLESIGTDLSFQDNISLKKIINFHKAYLFEDYIINKKIQNSIKISVFTGVDLKRQIQSVVSFYKNAKITDSHKSILSKYLLLLAKKTIKDPSDFRFSLLSLSPLFSIKNEDEDFQNCVYDIAMDNLREKHIHSSSFGLFRYKINDYFYPVSDEKIIKEINKLDQSFKKPQAILCEWQNNIDTLHDEIDKVKDQEFFKDQYNAIIKKFSEANPILYSLIECEIKNIKNDLNNLKQSLAQKLKFKQKEIVLSQNSHFSFHEGKNKIIFSKKKDGITYCFEKQNDKKYDLYFFEKDDILYIKEDNSFFAVSLKDLKHAAVKSLVSYMSDNLHFNYFGDIVLRKIFNYIFFFIPAITLCFCFYKVKDEKDFGKKIEMIIKTNKYPAVYSLVLFNLLQLCWSPSITAFDFYSMLEFIFCRK